MLGKTHKKAIRTTKLYDFSEKIKSILIQKRNIFRIKMEESTLKRNYCQLIDRILLVRITLI